MMGPTIRKGWRSRQGLLQSRKQTGLWLIAVIGSSVMFVTEPVIQKNCWSMPSVGRERDLFELQILQRKWIQVYEKAKKERYIFRSAFLFKRKSIISVILFRMITAPKIVFITMADSENHCLPINGIALISFPLDGGFLAL